MSRCQVKFDIRREAVTDVEAIRRILLEAFPTPLESRLVDALRSSGRLAISLVAEVGGRAVGHVAFSPVTVGESKGGLGLAPLAVVTEHQRRGIGGQLVVEGLKLARAAGAGFVVVLGDPDYYARFGFGPASRWQLQDEYGGGSAFQAIELRVGAIPQGGGLVRYAPEFALVAKPD